MKRKWECERCGECCTFIVIGIGGEGNIDLETEGYLAAHGIAISEDSKRLIIPAKCKYLEMDYRKQDGSGFIYRCKIHGDKFFNCRLAGKKECIKAKEDIKCLRALKCQ